MKKKLVSALALMMSCVMLTACGGNKVEENTATPQTETSEAVTESTEEAASTETEAAGELTDVNVAALKGPTAMGMVKLMDDSDNGDTGANHYNFTIAASPDEITPQIVQGNAKLLPEFIRIGSRRLRRNIDFFPHALKRFAKLLLAVRVEPRGIKKSDTGIICLSRQLHGVFRADPLDRKCAKPVLIDSNPCFSKCHSLHFFLHILLTHIAR